MTALPPRGSRVAIYAKATMAQAAASDHPASIADQIAICELFALGHGWTVVAAYTDNGRPCAKRRPGLMGLMHDAALGGFDVVLVREVERLSRSTDTVQRLLNMLGAAGVLVGVVTAPPALCAGCAQAEDEEIGDA